MKKFARLSALAAAVVFASTAHALDFNTIAGTSFTESFVLTPTATDQLVLLVSGQSSQYSALSFIISSGPTVVGKSSNGSLLAAFNDIRNTRFTLTGGTPYSLQIDGVTKAGLQGGYGAISISAVNGSVAALPVSPVPEPESYAMLLAGLGVIGTIARRRLKVNAA